MALIPALDIVYSYSKRLALLFLTAYTALNLFLVESWTESASKFLKNPSMDEAKLFLWLLTFLWDNEVFNLIALSGYLVCFISAIISLRMSMKSRPKLLLLRLGMPLGSLTYSG
jgi:hypothetical protein